MQKKKILIACVKVIRQQWSNNTVLIGENPNKNPNKNREQNMLFILPINKYKQNLYNNFIYNLPILIKYKINWVFNV